MKRKENFNPKAINVRSEKVRQILNNKPHLFLRWGMTIIFAIFVILLIIILNMEYPYGENETIYQHVFR